MHSLKAINYLLENFNFHTVLDVGSGAGEHAKIFLDGGKLVTCIDTGNSIYFNQSINKQSYNNLKLVISNFNEFNTNNKYDLVWCSHILEHQKNVGFFIEKCYSLLSDNGLLCITVPPLKKNIVGGHLTVWNTGLLLYNLIINGIDCSDAVCFQYGYNISIIVNKKETINIDSMNLAYDYGDIEKLKSFFPIKAYQGFNGDIEKINFIE
jgi:SAM-dependent methyltransferase